MTTQEVNALRKEGKLDEALAMGMELYKNTPEDLWAKRALSWVYYDLLKKAAEKNDFPEFISKLEALEALEVPAEEKMLYDNLVWVLFKMFNNLGREQNVDLVKINSLFDHIKPMPFNKEGDNYSILLKGLLNAFKDSPRAVEVIDWWDLNSLKQKDYLEEEYNGRKMMAVAERAFITYSKNLEQGKLIDEFGNREIDTDKIGGFLPRLNRLIEEHSDFLYPPYYRTKLLLKLERKEEALESFLPFAKKKRNDFWVWQLMAEINEDDQDLAFSCYCKALSLGGKDDFLVKVREEFAEILVNEKMFPEAKTEIIRIVDLKNLHQHKIPAKVQRWMESDWYENTTPQKDNTLLYKENLEKAEFLLYGDTPEEVIAITSVNPKKQMASFIKDKEVNGFFKYVGLLKKLHVGDILAVRFIGDSKNGYFKVATIRTDPKLSSDAVKTFEGNIKIIPSGVGFVKNIYVEKKLIERYHLADGEQIRVKAVMSFNKKRKEWGWKAFAIVES